MGTVPTVISKPLEPPSPAAPPVLSATGLGKSYDGVSVLRDVTLSLPSGLILGLIGENGAGKSTLIKCLNGMTTPSAGTIFLHGKPCGQQTVAKAFAQGIVTIPQEFNLVNDLTVTENIFLGHEQISCFGLLRRRSMLAQAQDALARLGANFAAERMVNTLSVAEKQLVEIAKALTTPCRVLILDEPTTVLNQAEVQHLFTVLRQLSSQGTAILFVSHRLSEIRELCSQVAILRDGDLVGLLATESLSELEMARRMVGRELNQLFPPRLPGAAADCEPVLEVSHLHVPGLLQDISFQLRSGELLGVAGLTGAGRTELAETLYGIHRPSAGTISLFGRQVNLRNPAEAVKAGIAYLPEERQKTAILTDFPVTANITLTSLLQKRQLFIDQKHELATAKKYIHDFGIKTESPLTPVRNLSGGNQQKVALAKGLDHQPRIIFLDEPTRGIDINARGDVYRLIHNLFQQGLSGLLISSDLEELIGLCNRVMVMRSGRIAGFLEHDQINEAAIMVLATGANEQFSQP